MLDAMDTPPIAALLAIGTSRDRKPEPDDAPMPTLAEMRAQMGAIRNRRHAPQPFRSAV